MPATITRLMKMDQEVWPSWVIVFGTAMDQCYNKEEQCCRRPTVAESLSDFGGCLSLLQSQPILETLWPFLHFLKLNWPWRLNYFSKFPPKQSRFQSKFFLERSRFVGQK
jgi:hypothetical protein